MAASITTTFDVTGGIVTYTVPTSGVYTITAVGAAGGSNGDSSGGLGALVSGAVTLTAGEVLQIAVGSTGASGIAGPAGGGGGGSFVVGPDDTPLEIAGGGGGAAIQGAGGNASGSSGSGTGGDAGAGYNAGGGGGGLLGDGGSDDANGDGQGGSAFVDGATGGIGVNGIGDGGFGGGGGGGDTNIDLWGAGGGGGGYSGGVGGAVEGFNDGSVGGNGDPGAGGTSFVSGSEQLVTQGENGANGLVAITLGVTGAPLIGGTQQLTTSDEASVDPFSTVVIIDPDDSPTDTVTVTYTAANGTLTDPNAAADGGTASAGSYTVTGTAAEVQADLRGLSFTPTEHQVAPGDTVSTVLTLSIGNADGTAQDTTTSVAATAVDDPPALGGTVADQAATVGVAMAPFSGVYFVNPDVGVTDTLQISVVDSNYNLTDGNGWLTGAGLTKTGVGTYSLAAASPATLTSELDALNFTPMAGTQTLFDIGTVQNVAGFGTRAADGLFDVSVDATNVVDGPSGGSGVLIARPGTNTMNAFGSFNHIFGDGGDDTINAGAGHALVDLSHDDATVMLQGASNDVVGGDGSVAVTGGTGGSSLVSLGDGTDIVTIGGENDTILLGNGNDQVAGTGGMAFIRTGDGNDSISLGGSGSTVYAGGGNNEIQGGAGSDTFVLSPAGSGFDTIAGFTETNGDVLDLRIALSATTWDGDMSTLGHYLLVTDSGGNTDLAIAPTGGGMTAPIATLQGAGNLGLADLLSHHSLLTG